MPQVYRLFSARHGKNLMRIPIGLRIADRSVRRNLSYGLFGVVQSNLPERFCLWRVGPRLNTRKFPEIKLTQCSCNAFERNLLVRVP